MQQSFFSRYRNLILIAIILTVFVYALVQYAVTQRVDRAVLETHTQLGELSGELKRLAETTAKNEAVAPYSSVVVDCSVPDRQRYNDLLGRLDQDLTSDELTALQRVFSDCAYLQSDRKLLMSDRLDREADFYRTLVDQLELLGQADEVYLVRAADWQSLADAEERRAELFAELVAQQRSIITELEAGASANDESIQTILQSVQQTQTELSDIRQRVAELHQALGVL